MNNPTIYYADINDHDETGSDEPAFCHVVLASEYNQLRAELAALKAGQGEAVARVGIVPGTDFKSLDFRVELQDLPVGTKLYTAPPASADTVSVAPGLERAIQIVREVAKTQPGYSDEREAIFEALSESYVEAKAPQHQPAPADAVSVPRELLERIADPFTNTEYLFEALRELRALLARSESKG